MKMELIQKENRIFLYEGGSLVNSFYSDLAALIHGLVAVVYDEDFALYKPKGDIVYRERLRVPVNDIAVSEEEEFATLTLSSGISLIIYKVEGDNVRQVYYSGDTCRELVVRTATHWVVVRLHKAEVIDTSGNVIRKVPFPEPLRFTDSTDVTDNEVVIGNKYVLTINNDAVQLRSI
jgi:hypothetical protein